ncbi:MAG: hypothetical protein KDB03_12240, partial [Planctomycetales bacterium]|nr:hypothetical protein [Planctomycetales bacterium]
SEGFMFSPSLTLRVRIGRFISAARLNSFLSQNQDGFKKTRWLIHFTYSNWTREIVLSRI